MHMTNQRLTIIRRARIACDEMLTRVQNNRFAQDSLFAANRHLRAARNFVLSGAPEFATIEMENACTHMRIALGATLS
jgi:hypothetical protein